MLDWFRSYQINRMIYILLAAISVFSLKIISRYIRRLKNE